MKILVRFAALVCSF